MKKRKLRSRIMAKYDTYKSFAEEIGVTKATLASWVNDGNIPSGRIKQMAKLLEISDEEIGEVFFPKTEEEVYD